MLLRFITLAMLFYGIGNVVDSFEEHDVTEDINKGGGISLGNGCNGVFDRYGYRGDLNLNDTIELNNVRFTIYGQLIDEGGTIKKLCETDQLIITR